MYEYGALKPPLIHVHEIKVPIMVVVAEHDKIADPKDNLELHSTLSLSLGYKKISGVDHVSLIQGSDMSYFEDIISVLKNPKLVKK